MSCEFCTLLDCLLLSFWPQQAIISSANFIHSFFFFFFFLLLLFFFSVFPFLLHHLFSSFVFSNALRFTPSGGCSLYLFVSSFPSFLPSFVFYSLCFKTHLQDFERVEVEVLGARLGQPVDLLVARPLGFLLLHRLDLYRGQYGTARRAVGAYLLQEAVQRVARRHGRPLSAAQERKKKGRRRRIKKERKQRW